MVKRQRVLETEKEEIEIEMNIVPLHTVDAGAEIDDFVDSPEDEIMEGEMMELRLMVLLIVLRMRL